MGSESSALIRRIASERRVILLARYADHEVALSATRNPDSAVRDLGLQVLRELAEGNNPFAIEALGKLDAGG